MFRHNGGWFLMINFVSHFTIVTNHLKIWPISWSVLYWTTEALTGNRELGFCSGEGAWEIATTSKEGSRRVNYPILIKRGSDKKSQYFSLGLNNCIENRVLILTINYWRASLVPAAAVIPAPIVYANIVAVKKLVVEFLRGSILCGIKLLQKNVIFLTLFFFTNGIHFLIVKLVWVYFEKIRVFKTVCLTAVYYSMAYYLMTPAHIFLVSVAGVMRAKVSRRY